MQTEKFTQKAILRKKFILLRNTLTKKDIEIKSRKVTQVFFEKIDISKFKKFLLYLPINNEVDTKSIIDKLISENKEVYLPKFSKDEWFLARFSDFNNLEKGPYGILQPKGQKAVINLNVALIPGVAFDKDGVRLGYGKGVYDKLLADFKGLKVGLGYDFQIVDKLPKESHDLEMDLIITEKELSKRPGLG